MIGAEGFRVSASTFLGGEDTTFYCLGFSSLAAMKSGLLWSSMITP